MSKKNLYAEAFIKKKKNWRKKIDQNFQTIISRFWFQLVYFPWESNKK